MALLGSHTSPLTNTAARRIGCYDGTSLELVPKLVSGDVTDSSVSLAWDRGEVAPQRRSPGQNGTVCVHRSVTCSTLGVG